MGSYQDEDGFAASKPTNIRPIRFRSLNINEAEEEWWSQHNDKNQNATESKDPVRGHKKQSPSTISKLIVSTKDAINLTNKITEPPPPAVLFDRVCFKVSASQQQSSRQYSNPIARILNQVVPTCGSSSDQDIQILKSIKLEVPQGCIFGLLGPSSCGKTTLLRCLVGLLKPSSGSIYLMGRPINKRKSTSREPNGGPSFGYMPQDLGLYEDFTIRQLLTMFGQYTGMQMDLIETRLQFMAKFLELPQVDRVINSLSGGQKRRVSFAIACIHMPPLIILDEPTVGVDPLLRQSIWRYLRELARDQGKTIIITTHYIEEAAQADQVALMRAGEILVQDSPKQIMANHNCDTLEDAFLQICSNVTKPKQAANDKQQIDTKGEDLLVRKKLNNSDQEQVDKVMVKFPIVDKFQDATNDINYENTEQLDKMNENQDRMMTQQGDNDDDHRYWIKPKRNRINISSYNIHELNNNKLDQQHKTNHNYNNNLNVVKNTQGTLSDDCAKGRGFRHKMREKMTLIYALFYKNYRRNMNSIPLIAFQFMLPIIQMISFSLCVGGRPSQVGLGLVNHDSLEQLASFKLNNVLINDPSMNYSTTVGNGTSMTTTINGLGGEDYVTIGDNLPQELLSKRYLDFIDPTVLNIKEYPNLELALKDVRRAKLWAAIEFGENFTSTLLTRFDPDNFYTLDRSTVAQSVIKLYPDKSNKILDMICMRILVNSFRDFLANQFDHLRQLPIQVKEVIFDIKPNLISNSLDGYTESIAAGLLASLTYIMAAGLTTFIMVVERGNGLLERTYTSGVNPVLYLLAHALFRSLVMMVQIGLVVFLTFYILQQPLVGSLGLAYFILMTLNFTGISYGLLVSSLVQDQNGAALTIVSSLVVKITMSGILWPLEAIPVWLRTACLLQPLTLPIQALKQITLKGATIEHRSVQLGFLVSFCWTCLFLFVAARRFKFYQH